MRHTRNLLLVSLLCACVSTIAAENVEGEELDWPTVFRNDLATIRQTIYADHPGPKDQLNPGFSRWLEAGFRQQLALADGVDSAEAYTYALQKYVAGFRDGHLNIRFDIERRAPRWPGFFATWRDGAVVAHSVDEALADELPAGSTLLGCDGQSPETILSRRVFDYRYDPEVPGLWVPAAANAFIDLGNPFVPIPYVCTFRRDSKEVTLELEWREFSLQEKRREYDAARGMLQPEAGLHSPEDGVQWLKAPTFGPNADQVATYNEAFRQLRDARQSASLVVFDLRGNTGGSSMWASEFVEALWDELPESADDENSFVEWRVSEGNIAHWATLPQLVRDQFGDDHPAVTWAEHVLDNLERTNARGEELWRETPVDDDTTQRAEAIGSSASGAPAFKGTVVLLTDTTCASACLDAMSLLSPLPGVIHAGSVTAADTQYMEARTIALPSGLATLVIPIKVYRGRVRPDGGYYTPRFRFDGLHWTDEALENWLLSLWHEGALGMRARQSTASRARSVRP